MPPHALTQYVHACLLVSPPVLFSGVTIISPLNLAVKHSLCYHSYYNDLFSVIVASCLLFLHWAGSCAALFTQNMIPKQYACPC